MASPMTTKKLVLSEAYLSSPVKLSGDITFRPTINIEGKIRKQLLAMEAGRVGI